MTGRNLLTLSPGERLILKINWHVGGGLLFCGCDLLFGDDIIVRSGVYNGNDSFFFLKVIFTGVLFLFTSLFQYYFSTTRRDRYIYLGNLHMKTQAKLQ